MTPWSFAYEYAKSSSSTDCNTGAEIAWTSTRKASNANALKRRPSQKIGRILECIYQTWMRFFLRYLFIKFQGPVGSRKKNSKWKQRETKKKKEKEKKWRDWTGQCWYYVGCSMSSTQAPTCSSKLAAKTVNMTVDHSTLSLSFHLDSITPKKKEGEKEIRLHNLLV